MAAIRQPSPIITGAAAKSFMDKINAPNPKKAQIMKQIRERTKNVKFTFK